MRRPWFLGWLCSFNLCDRWRENRSVCSTRKRSCLSSRLRWSSSAALCILWRTNLSARLQCARTCARFFWYKISFKQLPFTHTYKSSITTNYIQIHLRVYWWSSQAISGLFLPFLPLLSCATQHPALFYRSFVRIALRWKFSSSFPWPSPWTAI